MSDLADKWEALESAMRACGTAQLVRDALTDVRIALSAQELSGKRIEGWVLKNQDYHELGPFFGREEYVPQIRDKVRRAILFIPAEEDDE